MAEQEPSKLKTGVRFSSPAPGRIHAQLQEIGDGRISRLKPVPSRSGEPTQGSAWWVDATTADEVCKPAQWSVRDSFEAALDDVRQVCRRLDPHEFQLLMIDGVVKFRILEEPPGRAADIVWSWEWDEAGPPR